MPEPDKIEPRNLPAANIMPQERRTQEERSATTRSALLRAAVESLVATGYSGTSTTAVHERAGVSRGGMLHHFRSKMDLTLATLDHLLESQSQRLERAAARIKTADDRRLDDAVDAVWKEYRSPTSYAALEHWTAARTDQQLRRELRNKERAARPQIRTAFAELFGPEVEDHPAFDDAVDLTIEFMRGAALTFGVQRNTKRQQELIDRWKLLMGGLLNGQAH